MKFAILFPILLDSRAYGHPIDVENIANPNKVGDAAIYIKVAAKIDGIDENSKTKTQNAINSNSLMWCYEDFDSYKESLIATKALEDIGNCRTADCKCGSTAGAACAAQLVLSENESSFDKRMCGGCIYRLKLLDLIYYKHENGSSKAALKRDAYLYIKFYKAVHASTSETNAYIIESHSTDPTIESDTLLSTIESISKKPLILLEPRAMLHFYENGACQNSEKGLLIRMHKGSCVSGGEEKPFPSHGSGINFGNCNPTSDGVTISGSCNDLVKAISGQTFRAEIAKLPYECFTNFRLLPKEYFLEGESLDTEKSKPCDTSAEKEINIQCGNKAVSEGECIGRFRGVMNMSREGNDGSLSDENLPRLNCGNCYLIRLWTNSVNPIVQVKKYHTIDMRVKVSGEVSYKDGCIESDYRIPKDSQESVTKDGLNRDVELLWEPVKNGYKNLCTRKNCRLCVDKQVTDEMDMVLSNNLRKEIDTTDGSDYSFKIGGSNAEALTIEPIISKFDGVKIRRPFKHFIYMEGDEFGDLSYRNGHNGDKCGESYTEWKYVCFEADTKLRVYDGDTSCGPNGTNKKQITKARYGHGSADLNAFAATMMLLIGTENIPGTIVGPCQACAL